MNTKVLRSYHNLYGNTTSDAISFAIRGFTKIKVFISIWVFYNDHLRITGLQGKGESISLTPHYHFHPLHRHLDISQVIAAEISPLRIGRSRTRTRNLWFLSAGRSPLSYAL